MDEWKSLYHIDILHIYLALSSWEGIIETEDLDKVAEVAPLMKIFGYKPEIHRGEYDQFKSQVSKFDLFKKLLNAEIEFNYKPRKTKNHSKNTSLQITHKTADLDEFQKLTKIEL